MLRKRGKGQSGSSVYLEKFIRFFNSLPVSVTFTVQFLEDFGRNSSHQTVRPECRLWVSG